MCDGALTTTSENPLNILRDKTQWFTLSAAGVEQRKDDIRSKQRRHCIRFSVA